jgi:hypothetical protein
MRLNSYKLSQTRTSKAKDMRINDMKIFPGWKATTAHGVEIHVPACQKSCQPRKKQFFQYNLL